MYNKSKIMKTAWRILRDSKLDIMGYETRKGISFSEALTKAWADAKAHSAAVAGMTIEEQINALESKIFDLEMKSGWQPQDYIQRSKWQRELEALTAA